MFSIKQGRVYKYGGARKLEDLKEFALEKYSTVDSTPVPPHITWW